MARGHGAGIVARAAAARRAFFPFQRRGTAAAGAVFGPVMLVWFGTIGAQIQP